MSRFVQRILSLKNSYAFEKEHPVDLDRYFWKELLFQLKDMEARWLELEEVNWNQIHNVQQHVKVNCRFEQLLFRLEEILRFVDTNHGPRIVRFICREVVDILTEKRNLQMDLTLHEIEQVAMVFTVMNSYYMMPDLEELGLNPFDEMVDQMAKALHPILNK